MIQHLTSDKLERLENLQAELSNITQTMKMEYKSGTYVFTDICTGDDITELYNSVTAQILQIQKSA